MRRVDLPIGRQDGDGQRQVEAATLLPKVGRRKIDRKVSTWKDVTIVLHGGSYAIASFAHRLIAEARKMIHNAFREAHLDGNGSNVEAINGCTISLYKHAKRVKVVGRLIKTRRRGLSLRLSYQ